MNQVRSPAVEAFLACQDLDELQDRADEVAAELSDRRTASVSAAAITAALGQSAPELGAANLMFHPHLIPADQRVPVLLQSLAGPDVSYRVLAATAGVGAVSDDLYEGSLTRAVELLAGRCRSEIEVVRHRASAALFDLVRSADLPVLMDLFEVADELVAHNVAVAALRAAGPERLLSELRRRPGRNSSGADLIQALEGLGPNPRPVDILLSPLGVPSLVRIPDIQEWRRLIS